MNPDPESETPESLRALADQIAANGWLFADPAELRARADELAGEQLRFYAPLIEHPPTAATAEQAGKPTAEEHAYSFAQKDALIARLKEELAYVTRERDALLEIERAAIARARNEKPLHPHLCGGDREYLRPEGHCPECGERVPGRGSAPVPTEHAPYGRCARCYRPIDLPHGECTFCVAATEPAPKCPKCGSEELHRRHHEATFALPECDTTACGECDWVSEPS